MRPITLKLSGLQSYRETQQIDFDGLCEMGLFGIFGPTGSGKSTLLDAMTLALYGKVERATNGTQGIMNHSEDSLFVSFAFELTSAEGPQRYRVERRFKRLNELSVSNTVSRFIEITDEGEVVVADKLADVTRCVEDRIGLKMEDFTRAVVLPQGKFAEFLSLKGSERRQMLQRLFHLEKYGDQLALKLSRRVKDNDGALKEVEAEQQGLGNAGKEAVNEAKTRLKDTVNQAAASRTKLQHITREAEKLGKFWELQIEKERRENQLKDLATRESEIALMENRLGNSSAAQAIMPLLSQWTESKKEWAQRTKEASELQVKAEAADGAARRAYEADNSAQEALSAEEPKLLQRQEQLEQAVLLQRERDELKAGLGELAKQRSEAAFRGEELQKSLAKEQELLGKGLKKQSDLQESLKQLEIKAKDRERLHQAIRRLQLLTSCEQRRQKAEIELNEQEAKWNGLQSQLEQSDRDDEQLQRSHQQLLMSVSSHLEKVLEHENEIGSALSRLDQEEKYLRLRSKEQEIHALSLALASELKPGESCPVCGSAHHPSPASEAAAEPSGDERQLDELRDIRSSVQELRLSGRQLLHETRNLVGPKENSSEVEPQEAAAALEAVRASVSDSVSVFTESFSLSGWTSWMRDMEAASTALAACTTQLRKEQNSRQEQQDVFRGLKVKRTAELEAARELHRKLRSKFEVENHEYLRLQNEWSLEMPELKPEDAERHFAEMQQKDAQSEEIKERLQISVPFIEEKTAAVQSIERQIIELDKTLIQWNAQWQGKNDLLMEKEQRLFSWIGKDSATHLLENCKQRLLTLRAAAVEKKQHRMAAEQSMHETAKSAAMALQAAESAAGHFRAAEARWEQQLSVSPFASADEAKQACLLPEEESIWADHVRNHREHEREVMLQLRHLDEQLSGNEVTEEEWLKTAAELASCRQIDEEALQHRARAERDLDDVEKRHIRWSELEQVRKKRQLEAEKLSKLQSCLRGNAFVEYIAEEQLMQVSQSASQRLRFLTKQRYALEVDSGGGFLIRDDANGGVRRPVSTLSGGETFLASLSLALALSAQIQLRGQYPLQFFFLDEGFGTLDPELLDTVITSLEKLHNDRLSVGIISHVPELRARLPRKLIVVPAEHAGGGSRIITETM